MATTPNTFLATYGGELPLNLYPASEVPDIKAYLAGLLAQAPVDADHPNLTISYVYAQAYAYKAAVEMNRPESEGVGNASRTNRKPSHWLSKAHYWAQRYEADRKAAGLDPATPRRILEPSF